MEHSKEFEELHFIELSNKETLAYHKRNYPASENSLILLHGQAASSVFFEDLFIELEKNTKYDLYVLDMRGFGYSSNMNEIQSFSDLAEDIYLFILALNLNNNVSLAGISGTGGAVCQTFAINYPGILKTLILICSIGINGYASYIEETDSNGNKILKRCKNFEEIKNSNWGRASEALEKKDFEFWENIYQNLCFNVGKKMPKEKLYEYLKESFKQKNFLYIIWLLNIYNISKEDNGTGQISKIKTPTLIIHGDQDILIPLKDAQLTFAALGEKIAKIEVLHEYGHAIHMSAVDKVAPLMTNIINGIVQYHL